MARFINYTLQDAQCVPESTTVVGDIELWAQQYLETGMHLMDWNDRMGVMLERWSMPSNTADGMLSSVPSVDEDEVVTRRHAERYRCVTDNTVLRPLGLWPDAPRIFVTYGDVD